MKNGELTPILIFLFAALCTTASLSGQTRGDTAISSAGMMTSSWVNASNLNASSSVYGSQLCIGGDCKSSWPASVSNPVNGSGTAGYFAIWSESQGMISSSADLNSSNFTGTLPVARGGTGNGTVNQNGVVYGAGSAYASTGAGSDNQVLHANTGGAPTWSAVNLTADIAGILGVVNGGTGLSSLASGSLFFGSGGPILSALSIGGANAVLTSNGSAPQWSSSLIGLAWMNATGVNATQICLGGVCLATWPGAGGTNYWQVSGSWMSPNTTAGGQNNVNVTQLNATVIYQNGNQTLDSGGFNAANLTSGTVPLARVSGLTSGQLASGFTISGGNISGGSISGVTSVTATNLYASNALVSNSINRGPTNIPLFRWLPKEVLATYTGIGLGPWGIAFDGANMWVVNNGNNSVTKLSQTGVMTNYSGIGSTPRGIAFDGTNMWVTDYGNAGVIKITPGGNTTSYFGTGKWPNDIAFDGTNMWTENTGDNSVTKITPAGAMTNYSGTGWAPFGLAFDGTNMWTANQNDNSVTKVSPGGSMTNYTGTCVNPTGLAFDGTNMWAVCSGGGGAVTKITPTGAMTNFTGTGALPISIAFDGTNMWVTNWGGGGGNSVTMFTPDGVATTYGTIGNGPKGIAFDGTYIWTANGNGNSVSKILAVTK